MAATTAVWSVTRLYFLTEGKRNNVCVELDDEIHAVYAATSRSFCIVGELSVMLYDLERVEIIETFMSPEVLGVSWWSEGRLYVENGSREPLVFVPAAEGLGHVSAPGLG